MSDQIRIEIDTAPVREALNRLLAALGPAGLAPALKEIGEELAESTQQRFATGLAPDGSRWASNSQATYLALAGRSGKNVRQDGRLSARGSAVVMAKRPLVDSGLLRDSIGARVEAGAVFVGTGRIYAAMQHFGGTRAQFPHLWGDIPARPFLGLSAADEVAVVDLLNAHLADALAE